MISRADLELLTTQLLELRSVVKGKAFGMEITTSSQVHDALVVQDLVDSFDKVINSLRFFKLEPVTGGDHVNESDDPPQGVGHPMYRNANNRGGEVRQSKMRGRRREIHTPNPSQEGNEPTLKGGAAEGEGDGGTVE